jgi:hypothetical protein
MFDREVDVLLAFDLLSHLTEDQAGQFLTRARTCTRTAIVAVIASFDDEAEQARHRPADDRDRSHVTIRTRAWWHERFLQAGWRLDPLHRLGEARCREHPFPRRMRWKVYVYAA